MIYPKFPKRYLAIVVVCLIVTLAAVGTLLLIYLFSTAHSPLVASGDNRSRTLASSTLGLFRSSLPVLEKSQYLDSAMRLKLQLQLPTMSREPPSKVDHFQVEESVRDDGRVYYRDEGDYVGSTGEGSNVEWRKLQYADYVSAESLNLIKTKATKPLMTAATVSSKEKQMGISNRGDTIYIDDYEHPSAAISPTTAYPEQRNEQASAAKGDESYLEYFYEVLPNDCANDDYDCNNSRAGETEQNQGNFVNQKPTEGVPQRQNFVHPKRVVQKKGSDSVMKSNGNANFNKITVGSDNLSVQSKTVNNFEMDEEDGDIESDGDIGSGSGQRSLFSGEEEFSVDRETRKFIQRINNKMWKIKSNTPTTSGRVDDFRTKYPIGAGRRLGRKRMYEDSAKKVKTLHPNHTGLAGTNKPYNKSTNKNSRKLTAPLSNRDVAVTILPITKKLQNSLRQQNKALNVANVRDSELKGLSNNPGTMKKVDSTGLIEINLNGGSLRNISPGWTDFRTRRIIGNVKKSEERSRQLLLCEEAGGGELCRMLFKGDLNE